MLKPFTYQFDNNKLASNFLGAFTENNGFLISISCTCTPDLAYIAALAPIFAPISTISCLSTYIPIFTLF